MRDRLTDRLQNRIRQLGHPVVNPQSFAPGFDQSGIAQIGQVPRRLRLRNPEAFVDMTHADLTGEEQAQYPKPGGIGERFEEGFHLVQWLAHIFALTNISRPPTFSISVFADIEKGKAMSDIQQAVKEKYGAIANSVIKSSGHTGCCGPSACGCADAITSNLYSDAETEQLPADAVTASLGCGNPTALIALEPGQTVLDLGSGGGIDVLLSARRVGPTGKAYGLDMTDEMLALARNNQRQAGISNVEFLKGTIEAIPLPANSVDVIISNC